MKENLSHCFHICATVISFWLKVGRLLAVRLGLKSCAAVWALSRKVSRNHLSRASSFSSSMLENLKGNKFIVIVIYTLAAIATAVAMSATLDASLWNSPAPKGGKADTKGGAQGSQPHGKGKKRSQSGGPGKGDSKQQKAAPTGYMFGNNKNRLPKTTYPFGNGASPNDLAKFAGGSEYPGIVATTNHSLDAVPQLFDWYPCLNNGCSSPSRKVPPHERAGVSAFSIVSNPEIRCKYCLTQYVPVNTQRVVHMYQKPLVERLGGKLGPLHPKFKGSKLYGDAEHVLAVNQANYDPNKPPLLEWSLPTPQEWLQQNSTVGRMSPKTASLDAVQTAKASLARLETAVQQGEVTSFASLSRAASASSVGQAAAPAQPQEPQEEQPDLGIYKWLVASIAKAEQQGATSTAEALTEKLNADFPLGEPKPQEQPAPPVLSAPRELNLLAGKSAKALKELLGARDALDAAKDRVVACQAQLNEAKELATRASADLSLAATKYKEAGAAVKAFNDMVEARELTAASEIDQQLAGKGKTVKSEKPDVKNEQGTATYSAVVQGLGKSNSPIAPANPVLPRKAEDQEPTADGDQDMQEHEGSFHSQQTSASKRAKKAADAARQEQANDFATAGKVQLDSSLRENQTYLAELNIVCQKYHVDLNEFFAAIDKGENLILQMSEQKPTEDDV